LKLVDGVLIGRARRLRRDATDAERRLWSKLRNFGLGVRFVRQHPIGPYIADFACRSAKLIVEVDGGQHAGERDRRRDAYLTGRGYLILRFWNPEVLANTVGVLETIRLSLVGRVRG
jgi:very-short-patch-repair endonuclease